MKDNKYPELRFVEFSGPWKTFTLKELSKNINTGKSSYNKNEKTSKYPYPILGSTSIIGYDDTFDYEGNFILTARVGANAGNLYLYSGKAKITDNTVFIQGENIDFLYAFLTQFNLKKLSFGSGQPLIKSSELKEIKVNSPDSTERREIGSFFNKMDHVITLYQQELDTLKQTKKGFLQKMFPKKGETVPELRFPGFNDNWKLCKLSSLAGYKNGKGHESSQSNSGVYELVNLNSISIDGGFKPSGKFIDHTTETLRKYDLVMVLSDIAHGNLLGRVAIIPEDNKFVLNQRVALLRPHENVNSIFLHTYINQHQYYFKSLGAGMSQLNISRGTVENFEDLVPGLEEQKYIGEFFSKIDGVIMLHQQELDALKQTKKAFLQKMFV